MDVLGLGRSKRRKKTRVLAGFWMMLDYLASIYGAQERT